MHLECILYKKIDNGSKQYLRVYECLKNLVTSQVSNLFRFYSAWQHNNAALGIQCMHILCGMHALVKQLQIIVIVDNSHTTVTLPREL